MRNNYTITGLFYEEGKYKFRKYLNIVNKKSNITTPDLMVIMMNPGSSKPLSDCENTKIEVSAIPDNTQNQIMKVMQICKYNYARILNLSDLRNPNSSSFYKELDKLEREKISHSIFDESRLEEFHELFVKNVPVIYAWGVNKKLTKLARMASEKIEIPNPIGWQKENHDFAFYHPLIRTKQNKWIETITELLPEKLNNN